MMGKKKKSRLVNVTKHHWKDKRAFVLQGQHGESLVALGIHDNRSRLSHGSHGNASAAPQRADGAGPRRHPGRTAVCHSVAAGPGRAGTGRTNALARMLSL